MEQSKIIDMLETYHLPPNTTSQALLTQDELAISDEPCELQQQ